MHRAAAAVDAAQFYKNMTPVVTAQTASPPTSIDTRDLTLRRRLRAELAELEELLTPYEDEFAQILQIWHSHFREALHNEDIEFVRDIYIDACRELLQDPIGHIPSLHRVMPAMIRWLERHGIALALPDAVLPQPEIAPTAPAEEPDPMEIIQKILQEEQNHLDPGAAVEAELQETFQSLEAALAQRVHAEFDAVAQRREQFVREFTQNIQTLLAQDQNLFANLEAEIVQLNQNARALTARNEELQHQLDWNANRLPELERKAVQLKMGINELYRKIQEQKSSNRSRWRVLGILVGCALGTVLLSTAFASSSAGVAMIPMKSGVGIRVFAPL